MTSRPNILLLISDDHRWDVLGALGHQDVRTPHLDALAREGVLFSHLHCMGSCVPAVCMPARAMLHTGRNLFRIPREMTYDANCPAPSPSNLADTLLLGEVLRASGYESYHVGKWHNGRESLRRSYDGGDAIFLGGMCSHYAVPCHPWDPEGVYSRDTERVSHRHSDDIFSGSAVQFLVSRESAAPFYLQVAFTSPHDPRMARPPFRDLYHPEMIAIPPNCLPAPAFDNGALQIRDELIEPAPRSEDAVRKHLADYYGMVSGLDDAIGQVLLALDHCGARENTLVIYVSDHGLSLGQHGLMGKQNLYDHAIRAPLILSGANLPRGEISDALCYHFDVFATILEAAGLSQPSGTDGVSLFRALEPGPYWPRQDVRGYYRECQTMIKSHAAKIIRYHVNGESREERFDLATDPWEMRNLFNIENPETLRPELAGELSKLAEYGFEGIPS